MPVIGAGQRAALLEAFHTTVTLLPGNLRNGLILVGGTSLLSLGGTSKTEDVDSQLPLPPSTLSTTPPSTILDSKKGPIEDWSYTSSSGIIVSLEKEVAHRDVDYGTNSMPNPRVGDGWDWHDLLVGVWSRQLWSTPDMKCLNIPEQSCSGQE
jgi:hypothetical protein